MSWRRSIGALLLFAWCAGPALSSLAATADPHHNCTDHACQCQRGCCPPKKSAAKGCHETAEGSSRPCELQSHCKHETDRLPPASRFDTILSAKEQLGVDVAWQAVEAVPSGDVDAGHTRLDPQPPRVAS